MADRGGFKQRLKRQRQLEQQQQQQPQQEHGATQGQGGGEGAQNESKLAVLLIQRWCWGTLSLPALQELAQATEEDGLQHPLIRTTHTHTLTKAQSHTPNALSQPNVNFCHHMSCIPKSTQSVKYPINFTHCCLILPQTLEDTSCRKSHVSKPCQSLSSHQQLTPTIMHAHRKLASLGSRGAYANHMQRDILRPNSCAASWLKPSNLVIFHANACHQPI